MVAPLGYWLQKSRPEAALVGSEATRIRVAQDPLVAGVIVDEAAGAHAVGDAVPMKLDRGGQRFIQTGMRRHALGGLRVDVIAQQ